MKERKFYIIAHNIRSLLNVGSIFRTADAFGADKIYLTGYTPTPELVKHRLKISKVALGAEDYVKWQSEKSAVRLIKKLKSKNVKIIGLENNISLSTIINSKQAKTFIKASKQGIALVLGEERKGINKNVLKLCDIIIEIPMKGKKESLNVSVAFGIVAYEITRK